jgi:hypothetical protein
MSDSDNNTNSSDILILEDVLEDDEHMDNESNYDDEEEPYTPEELNDDPEPYNIAEQYDNTIDVSDEDDTEEESDDDVEFVANPQSNDGNVQPNDVNELQQYFHGYNRQSLFLKNIIKIRTGVPVNIWKQGYNFMALPVESNDVKEELEIIRMQNMAVLVDQIPTIFDTIPKDIKEIDSVKRYISETSLHFNGLINIFSQYDIFEFVPIEMFLWIALMEACHKEHTIIPFLMTHKNFNNDLLKREGYSGMNCIKFACMSDTADSLSTLMDLDIFTENDLKQPGPFGYTAIMWAAAFSQHVTDYIITNKLVSKDDFWKGINGNSIDPLMIACELGSNSSAVILKSDYMEEKYYNKAYHKNYTPDMVILGKNLELGKTFLESKYCTLDSINTKKNSNNKMLLHIMVTVNYNAAKYLLTHDYIDQRSLLHEWDGQFNTKHNIMSISIKLPDLIKEIVNHKDYSNKLLTFVSGNVPLIYSFLSFPKSFEYILNNLDDDILNTKYTDHTLLTYSCTKNLGTVEMIINHPKFTQEMFNYKYKNKNCFELLKTVMYKSIHAINTNANALIKSKFVNKEFLGTDADIVKLVKLDNSIGPALLRHHKISNSSLIDHGIVAKNVVKLPIYYWILKKHNDKLAIVKLLFENYEEVIDTDILETKINDDNFLHLLEKSEKSIEYILLSDKCNKKLLEDTNHDGNNILSLCILNKYIDRVEQILNHKLCSQTIVNSINKSKMTPFTLALQNSFEIAAIISESKYYVEDKKLDSEVCLKLLHDSIKKKNIVGVQLIMNMPSFSKESLMIQDIDNNNCFHYASESTLEIFEYLLDKHDDKNIMNIKNKHNQYCFDIAVNNNDKIACKMLDLDIVTIDMIKNKESDKYTPFHRACLMKKKDIVDKLLAYSKFTPEDITVKTTENISIFGYDELIDDILVSIIKSDHFNQDMLVDNVKMNGRLQNKNVNIKIPYFLLMVYRSRLNVITEILNKITDDKLLKLCDEKKNNLLYLIVSIKENFTLLDKVIHNKYMSKDILCMSNSEGETAFMHLCLLSTDIVKSVMESEHFSTNILMKKTNSGNTCLYYVQTKKSIEYILESKHCTKEFIDVSLNSNNDNVLTQLIIKKIFVKEFIMSKFMKSEMLIEEDKQGISTIEHILQYDKDNETDVFVYMLDKKIITQDIVDQITTKIKRHLFWLCAVFNVGFVKLLHSDLDLWAAFDQLETFMSFIKVFLSQSFNLFKEYTESKYFKIDYILKGDEYNHNILTILHKLDDEDLLWFVNNDKLWVDSVKYYGDIDNDTLLMFLSQNSTKVKLLLENDKIDNTMVLRKNNYEFNIFQYCITHKYIDSFELLIDEFDITEFMTLDNSNKNLFCLACDKCPEIAYLLVNGGYVTENVLKCKTKHGVSPLLLALKRCKNVAKKILELECCSETILNQTDSIGNSCLMYASEYASDFVEKILKHKHFNNNMLQHRNNYEHTCLIHASIHSESSVKQYLEIDSVDTDLAYFKHMDMGSALTYAAKYQPKAIKYFLEWDKMTWKLLMTLSNLQTFLQIGAIHNTDVVKYSIDSKWDMTKIFTTTYLVKDSEEHDSPVILAAKFQPEALNYIINSKYCTEQIILLMSEDKKLCHQFALEFQPLSLYYLLKSDNDIIKRLLKVPYDNGYTILDSVKLGNPAIKSLEDIANKLPIIKCKNIRCAEDDDIACQICCGFKAKICFKPCMHTVCAACSLQLKKCPACRVIIKDKVQLW